MPQDPNLYGQPPPKKQKKSMPLSSSLDFASQVTSLLSSTSAAPTTSSSLSHGRIRPSKSKTDALFSVKAKRKPGARQPNDDASNKITLKSPTTTEDEKATLAAARRKMEEKARLYAAMKRGDYVPGREGEAAPLVDFDRKWAEAQQKGSGIVRDSDNSSDDNASSSSGEDDDDKAEQRRLEELVEYEDEFGRLRRVTRREHEAHLRRLARGQHASAELEAMSARPAAPSRLIYGAAPQVDAFVVEDPDRMEELARKRDRSATPPEEKHYDAKEEIRNRGTGFYAFSKDEEERRRAMEGLERERLETERVRREREERAEKRRREIEERRKQVGERKARKMADSFLESLEEKFAARGVVVKSPEEPTGAVSATVHAGAAGGASAGAGAGATAETGGT